MQPLSLTLKGFRGIRDGLGRDVLTLNFERMADGAELVAIVGANGRGKTTVMDNMHPYLTMPSRATVAGPGGFSYYDHVCLPENEKDLIWAHDCHSYRSQVVIRLNGRRKTEAFLLLLADDGAWKPMVLDKWPERDPRQECQQTLDPGGAPFRACPCNREEPNCCASQTSLNFWLRGIHAAGSSGPGARRPVRPRLNEGISLATDPGFPCGKGPGRYSRTDRLLCTSTCRNARRIPCIWTDR